MREDAASSKGQGFRNWWKHQLDRGASPEERAFEWPKDELPSAWRSKNLNDRELIRRQAAAARAGVDRIIGPSIAPNLNRKFDMAFDIAGDGAQEHLRVHFGGIHRARKWLPLLVVAVIAGVGLLGATAVVLTMRTSIIDFLRAAAFFAVIGSFLAIPLSIVLLLAPRIYTREFAVRSGDRGFETSFTYASIGTRRTTEVFKGAPDPMVLDSVMLNPYWTGSRGGRLVKHYPGRWCVLALVIEDAVVFARYDREREPIEAAAAEFARELQALSTPPKEP